MSSPTLPGDSSPPAQSTSLFNQPKAVWATAFACVVGFMSIGLVDPILTSIAKGLQATPSQVSLLFTSYFLVTSLMMLVTGFVASRLGSRLTLLLGATLIVIFAALAGTSTSVTELVTFRAGWGLGNAFFVVTALSVIVAVARGGTGRAVLLYEAAMGLGLSAGPLIGAALGSHSWRWPFFGTATLMAIGLVSIMMFLPHQPKPQKKISLQAPLMALRHPGLFTVSLAGFFYYFAFFTVLAFAPFVLNMPAKAVGLIFFGWGVLLAIFSVLVAPRLEARFGILPVIYVSLIILAALVITMGLASPMVIAICVVLSGAVMGICNTYFTEIALDVSDAPRPVASAGYNFLRWFAGVIAPYAVPVIAEHTNVTTAFSVAAVAALVAPVIFLLRRGTLTAPAKSEAPAAVIRGAEITLRPVVAAIDGSATDIAVLNKAIALAKLLNTSVLALHVRMSEVFGEGQADLETASEAQEAVDKALVWMKQANLANGRAEILRAAAGAASRDVALRAKAYGAPYIVLGAPHTGDLGDLVHGSFAAAMASEATSGPALVVVPTQEPSSTKPAEMTDAGLVVQGAE